MNRLSFLRGVAAVLAAPLALRSLAEEPLHPLARPYPSHLHREVGRAMWEALRTVKWTGCSHTKITALVAVKGALESRWPEHGFSYQVLSEVLDGQAVNPVLTVIVGVDPLREGFPFRVSKTVQPNDDWATVFVWASPSGLKSHTNPELT